MKLCKSHYEYFKRLEVPDVEAFEIVPSDRCENGEKYCRHGDDGKYVPGFGV